MAMMILGKKSFRKIIVKIHRASVNDLTFAHQIFFFIYKPMVKSSSAAPPRATQHLQEKHPSWVQCLVLTAVTAPFIPEDSPQ